MVGSLEHTLGEEYGAPSNVLCLSLLSDHEA